MPGKYINPFTDFGFKKNFGVAELANLTPEQLSEYDESLKVYRDLKGCLDTAFEDGFNNGFNKALDDLNPKLEKEKRLAEEADQRAKKEKQRAKEADQRAKEEKQRAEDIIQKAIKTMIAQGKTESEAREELGL